MLGLKLNHVSKRGHWPCLLISIVSLTLQTSYCWGIARIVTPLQFVQSFHEYQFFKLTNENDLKQNGRVSDVCALTELLDIV